MAEDANDEPRMFSVDTNFQKMARRPGGTPREEAIERAKAKIEELNPSFNKWFDRELQELVDLAQKCKASSTDKSQFINAIGLHSRQLRDVGTTMGFELVTFVANNLWEISEAIRAGAEYRGDLIDCHVEALLLAKQQRYRHLRPDQLPELSAGLRRVVEFVNTYPDCLLK